MLSSHIYNIVKILVYYTVLDLVCNARSVESSIFLDAKILNQKRDFELIMIYGQLFIISQLFRFDSNTRSVDLSDNKIGKIDQFPEDLNQMQTLDLSHNEIKFIEYDAFDNLGRVTIYWG